MKNNRGLSTIVTTLIIILLVFVAVGIIWAVVQGVLNEGGDTVNYSAECLAISVDVTSASCTSTDCTVTVTRGSGGGDIGGTYVVLFDDAGSKRFKMTNGALEPLASATQTFSAADEEGTPSFTWASADSTKTTANAYILTETEDEYICQ